MGWLNALLFSPASHLKSLTASFSRFRWIYGCAYIHCGDYIPIDTLRLESDQGLVQKLVLGRSRGSAADIPLSV